MSRQEKIAALMDAFMQMKRSMTRHMVEADTCPATPVQVEILIRIARGETKAANLAAAMHATPSAITQHVNALEEQGFVKKTVSKADKRQTELSLTTAGKHVIEVKQQFMRKRVEQVVEALTDEELNQFIAICKKIANNN